MVQSSVRHLWGIFTATALTALLIVGWSSPAAQKERIQRWLDIWLRFPATPPDQGQ